MENRLTQELLNPFLFAVPAVEALGVMLLPMLAASDLPFPRLSAFARRRAPRLPLPRSERS